MDTYLGIARFSALDTNDLGDSLVAVLGMVNKLLLHHGSIFKVSWLVTSLVEIVGF